MLAPNTISQTNVIIKFSAIVLKLGCMIVVARKMDLLKLLEHRNNFIVPPKKFETHKPSDNLATLIKTVKLFFS